MGSAGPSLPIIDISPFLSTDPANAATERNATVKALANACSQYGFFYLKGHGIPASNTFRIISYARRFFQESPPEQKALIKRQDPGIGLGDGARGYQITGENVTKGKRDWHEGLDLYCPVEKDEWLEAKDLDSEPSKQRVVNGTDTSKQARSHRQPPFNLLEGINLWPSHPPDFHAVYTEYIADLRRVGAAVLRAMGEALQLKDPDVFVKATGDSFWVMRAIGYPPLDADLASQGGVSCGEHTDYGCLTLLLSDETKGALQVLHRLPDGSEAWISADPIEGAYVVNVGDMIELWTNGLVKSTLHRVVYTGQNYRVSVPFFLEPDRDAEVEPLEECVQRSGRPAVGKKVMYGNHLASKVGGNFYGSGGSS